MYSRQFTQFILGLVFLVSSGFAYSNTYKLSVDDATSVSINFYNDVGALQFSENATSNEDNIWSVVLDGSSNFV